MTRRSVAIAFVIMSCFGAQAADGFYVGASGASYSIETETLGVHPGPYPLYTYPVCGGTASYRLAAPQFSSLAGDVATGIAQIGWRHGAVRLELELAPELTLEQSGTATPNFGVTQATCVPPYMTTLIAPTYFGTRRYTLDQTTLAVAYRVVGRGETRLELRLQAASWRSQLDQQYTHTVAESVGGVVVATNIIQDDTSRTTDEGIELGFGIDFAHALGDRWDLNAGLRSQGYGDASSTTLKVGVSYTF